MRIRILAAVAAITTCASCSAPATWKVPHDLLRVDWNWQQHVLERRSMWDEATGRKHEYDGVSAQLAR
ncbi:MAG: hypothetical protein AAF961_08390 [Planctomycetota bacterium]